MAEMNGREPDEPAPTEPPVLAIQEVIARGVDAAGTAGRILVQTATQQIALHADFENLVNLWLQIKAAIHECRKNQVAAGAQDQRQCVQVNSYGVGHSQDIVGTLMIIDPDAATEMTYILEAFQAVDLGRKLVSEGQALQKRTEALNGLSTKPVHKTKGGLILPPGTTRQ